MGDRAIALGGLVAVPINIGIVTGAALHHIGMSDVWCAAAGTAIAVLGGLVIYALLMRYLRKQDRA